ncbi:MAG TPA: hypothetical protein VGX25_12985, partial [Actinophytocola sp.]|nr:hypothetical protein [Actinophytocola sp.]
AGGGSGRGAGGATGLRSPGAAATEAAAGGRGAAGVRGGGGMAGMPVGARGGGDGDTEHERPAYLQEPDPESLFGTDELCAPPVIGADEE